MFNGLRTIRYALRDILRDYNSRKYTDSAIAVWENDLDKHMRILEDSINAIRDATNQALVTAQEHNIMLSWDIIALQERVIVLEERVITLERRVAALGDTVKPFVRFI